MSKSRRRRKSSSSKSFSVRKKRSGFRTFIETVMGVSIGLMILAFVGWWYFLREAPEPISVSQVNNAAIKDNVVDDAASYESVRDNGTLDEQKHLLSQLDNCRVMRRRQYELKLFHADLKSLKRFKKG